jgi:hypothetical protein
MRRLLLVVLGLTSALVGAQSMDGLFLQGRRYDTPQLGAVRVDVGFEAGRFAERGAPITPDRVVVYARDNANTRFALDARHPAPCGSALLILGGRVIAGNSHGRDDNGCSAHLELGLEDASRAARFFGVPRQDRHPIGEHLIGSFATSKRRYAVGETVEVTVTLRNPGMPVRWQRGGRNRGPRDDQFDFVVRRNGHVVPRIEAYNFGGLSTYRPLATGESATVSTALAPFADLAAPGRYEVECRYETVLVPTDRDPHDDGSRGAAWDRAFVGVVHFEIR